MSFLIHPSYFPNIVTMAVVNRHACTWEVCDYYQKQTYRNRCHIATDQGKHLLTIPIKHVGGAQGKQYYKEVRLKNEYNWQRQHWRTLQTAYRTSPFFEYYEDDLAPLYNMPFEYLLDFNFKSIEIVCECLQLPMPEQKTSRYEAIPEHGKDFRWLVNAKRPIAFDPPPYPQVFDDRHGFIPNLSILDLLFNEGTAALTYLEKLPLSFING